jgi:hypothetical protein
MKVNGSNSYSKEQAAKGATKLTAKQETLCQLIALQGHDQSEAYRQAYDVSLDTLPATVWSEASRLVANPKVAARIEELREAYQERTMVSAEEVIQELKQVGMATVTSDVRPSDKVAALDKMAKILGLYRDPEKDRDAQAVQITKVTVVLDRGHG